MSTANPMFAFALLAALGAAGLSPSPLSSGDNTMALTITSSAFTEGAMIPGKHTCDAEDISPDLSWSGVPQGAKSLALICDDPDAPVGTWVHWVLFNLPADVTALPAGIPADAVLKNGARHGKNDFRKLGYGGPCPPGGTHRYYFKLYALDTVLTLQSGSTKAELLAAMQGHILAEAQLMGKYKR
jgi:Raf kinase inhibitor-like YbhB/YbcL family protein